MNHIDVLALARELDLDPCGRGARERRIRCPHGCKGSEEKRSKYAASLHIGGGDRHGLYYCPRCERGGSLERLDPGRAATMERAEAPPVPPPERPLPMPRAWDALYRHRDHGGLEEWAARRGWPNELVDLLRDHPQVMCAPHKADQVGVDGRRLHAYAVKCRRPVLFAIHDGRGEVRSAMRRYIGEAPDELAKTLSLRSDLCPVKGARVLGRIPDWVAAAQAGETVYLAEGEPDWLALDLLCRLNEWGACVGSPFAGGLVDVAHAAVEAGGGSCAGWEVVVVPHLGDTGKTERVRGAGLKKMKAAGRALAAAGASVEVVMLGPEDVKADAALVLERQGRDALECLLSEAGVPLSAEPEHITADPTGALGGGVGGGTGAGAGTGAGSGVGGAMPDGGWPMTDLGNSERMSHHHGHDLRYVPTHGRWYVWDGTRFAFDELGQVVELAKRCVRGIREEASAQPDDNLRADLYKHARRSEAGGKIEAMLKLTRSVPGVATSSAHLDADPWLMTCDNGTLDLRTGDLLPHSRAHNITRMAPVAYDPDAPCPSWEAFLLSSMDDRPHLVDFLQRAAGYSLCGDPREECLFLLLGSGRNGKGTFVGTLQRLLGGYQATCSFDTFLTRPTGGVRNDLAKLDKVRLVTASEPNKGAKMDEGLVKTLTGRDTITARFLYGEEFEFVPQFKLWLMANHKPVIRGTDNGIWSRMRLIPWDVSFLGREDKGLKRRLLDESAGIFAWMVEGCRMWQRDGLCEPDEVLAATAEYREEMDRVGRFLATECDTTQGAARVAVADLYAAYERWGQQDGEYTMSKRQLGTELKARGFASIKSGSTRYWQGIELLSGSGGVF